MALSKAWMSWSILLRDVSEEHLFKHEFIVNILQGVETIHDLAYSHVMAYHPVPILVPKRVISISIIPLDVCLMRWWKASTKCSGITATGKCMFVPIAFILVH